MKRECKIEVNEEKLNETERASAEMSRSSQDFNEMTERISALSGNSSDSFWGGNKTLIIGASVIALFVIVVKKKIADYVFLQDELRGSQTFPGVLFFFLVILPPFPPSSCHHRAWGSKKKIKQMVCQLSHKLFTSPFLSPKLSGKSFYGTI